MKNLSRYTKRGENCQRKKRTRQNKISLQILCSNNSSIPCSIQIHILFHKDWFKTSNFHLSRNNFIRFSEFIWSYKKNFTKTFVNMFIMQMTPILRAQKIWSCTKIRLSNKLLKYTIEQCYFT